MAQEAEPGPPARAARFDPPPPAGAAAAGAGLLSRDSERTAPLRSERKRAPALRFELRRGWRPCRRQPDALAPPDRNRSTLFPSRGGFQPVTPVTPLMFLTVLLQ